MNVHPETAILYTITAFLNLIGLPADMAYFVFLNTAKDGITQAIAQNTLVQIVAFGNLAISALGCLVGVLANLLSYFAFWGVPFMQVVLAILWLDTSYNRKIDDLINRTIFLYMYEWGFKLSIFFMPFYSMFSMALSYAMYIVDVSL